ncbi:hypothetical protein SLS62_008853 [Diatrype stigma]|uniref:Carbohydrate-binding domain-containing protein n=1 Tax=Diatrype stigma TaxID=117547 RepID=A0AAN9UHI0_9PEZI
MRASSIVYAATAAAAAANCNPSLEVPACPSKGTVQYDKSMPEGADFPLTQVDLCYDESALQLTFTAYNETSFYTNGSYGTNDPIYEYEVMEAFIYRGTADPQSYLELEVSPRNVTFQAFIYNPSKVRAAGAPFDRFYIADPLVDGLTAETTLDEAAETWVSTASVPLGLFNVDSGEAKGTEWRMNFFRTVVAPETFPDQGLGAWSPTDEASFHKTPFFGNVKFV